MPKPLDAQRDQLEGSDVAVLPTDADKANDGVS